jgi:hypothetical protein
MTLDITALGLMTLTVMIFSMTTLGITARYPNSTQLKDTCHRTLGIKNY